MAGARSGAERIPGSAVLSRVEGRFTLASDERWVVVDRGPALATIILTALITDKAAIVLAHHRGFGTRCRCHQFALPSTARTVGCASSASVPACATRSTSSSGK